MGPDAKLLLRTGASGQSPSQAAEGAHAQPPLLRGYWRETAAVHKRGRQLLYTCTQNVRVLDWMGVVRGGVFFYKDGMECQ